MTRVLTAWRASNLPLPAPHAVGIAAGIGLHHLRPWTLPGPRWTHQLIGLPLIAAAAQLTARSMAAASEVQLAFPDRLVQTGPYATSRNPMYLAWTLLHLGVGIAHGSIWIVATTPAAVGWVHSAVRGEERTLSAQFGDEFERYRAAVPRYLRRPQRSPFHPRRSVRTVARTADHTMTTRKA